jgi:tetratricopeptide (TPR) repeat protein
MKTTPRNVFARRLLVCAVVACQFGSSAGAAGAANEYKLHLQSAEKSLSSGMVGEAHTAIDQAMEAAGADPLKQADCYELLGRVQIAENVLGLADDSFKKALELRESKLGPKDPVVLRTCKEYASLLEKLDRKDEARQLLERVTIATASAKVESAGKTTAKAVGKGQSKFDQYVLAARQAEEKVDDEGALANWKLAAEEAEKAGSKERLSFALVHLGDKYLAKKDNEQGTANYEKALAIRQSSSANQNLGMVRNLTRLANLQMAKQKYGEAQKFLEQALAIEEQTSGGDCLRGTTLQSLASISMMNSQNAKAEEYSKKLLELADKSNGALANQYRMTARGVLMGLYFRTGRNQEAMKLRDEVTSSMSQTSSSDHIKAVQAAFAAGEKEVDESEEKSFKP